MSGWTRTPLKDGWINHDLGVVCLPTYPDSRRGWSAHWLDPDEPVDAAGFVNLDLTTHYHTTIADTHLLATAKQSAERAARRGRPTTW